MNERENRLQSTTSFALVWGLGMGELMIILVIVTMLFGAKRIPNRVDPWGRDYHHNWNTWREMLPKYLAEHA